MHQQCPYCGRPLLNHRVDRCQYCGRELPTELRLIKPEKKKLKCPQCGRVIINRLSDECLYCKASLPPEMRLSAEEREKQLAELQARFKAEEHARVEQTLGMAVMTSDFDREAKDEEMYDFLSWLPWTKSFIPRYNELSLFLISLAFLLLAWLNPSLRMILVACIKTGHPLVLLLVALFGAGLGLSLFTVFTTRIPSQGEKHLMLLFAVLTSAGAGIACGVHIIRSERLLAVRGNWWWLLLLLPAWNILSSLYLLVLLRYHVINESDISDEQVQVSQFLLHTGILLMTLLICHFVLHWYWAITFSISVAYATVTRSRSKQVLNEVSCG